MAKPNSIQFKAQGQAQPNFANVPAQFLPANYQMGAGGFENQQPNNMQNNLQYQQQLADYNSRLALARAKDARSGMNGFNERIFNILNSMPQNNLVPYINRAQMQQAPAPVNTVYSGMSNPPMYSSPAMAYTASQGSTPMPMTQMASPDYQAQLAYNNIPGNVSTMAPRMYAGIQNGQAQMEASGIQGNYSTPMPPRNTNIGRDNIPSSPYGYDPNDPGNMAVLRQPLPINPVPLREYSNPSQAAITNNNIPSNVGGPGPNNYYGQEGQAYQEASNYDNGYVANEQRPDMSAMMDYNNIDGNVSDGSAYQSYDDSDNYGRGYNYAPATDQSNYDWR